MDNELNIEKIARNIFALFKWMSIFAFVVSIIGLGIAVKRDYPLFIGSSVTSGNISSFEEKQLSTVGKLSAANLFPYKVAVVTFKDDQGILRKVLSRYGNSNSSIGDTVQVIYSRDNPDMAIIDQGLFHNWLTEYILVFVLLFSLMGIRRFSSTHTSKNIEKISNTHE